VLSSTTLALPTQVFIGLSVTSHNLGVATTATFTNVSVTGAASPPPSVTTLSPATGAVGTAVTISGANFGTTQGSSVVQFNGTVAAPSSWSNTSIVVPVPAGATTGPVVVTVNSVASNSVGFTIPIPIPAPSLTSLSPTTGAVGTAVTISGANFGATQGSSVVQFNGTSTTPSSWSNTSIVVPVPAGATSGPVVVTVNAVASNSATFTVSTASAPLTGPWTDQDVGAPVVAGNASVTGGTFTVTGAGTDIWDVNDQFHFMYQPLTGDGQIVARVASLQNTDAWAKAGVMIRAALTGGSVNAVAQVTAGNGMTFQQRSTTGGTSTFVQGPGGAAPQWVRLVRSGNTVTGYTSVDGTTWTMLSSTTLALPTQVFIGLSVTSHNLGVATTATFTNVTVTQP